MIKYFFFIVLMMSSTSCYGLDASSDRCEFFFLGEATSDADVPELLKAVKPDEAVKLCIGGNGNKAYYVASAVSKNGEVSYFYLSRVFKILVADGHRWDFLPPEDLLHLAVREVYMQNVIEKDVKQDDSGFVQVQGMSVGLFRALSKAWNDMLSSEQLFKEASSGLSMAANLASDITLLKQALYDNDKDKDAPSILTAGFVEGSDSSFPHYTFSVLNGEEMWSIEFDFIGCDIRFEGIVQISG
jgi:hypothetical protein